MSAFNDEEILITFEELKHLQIEDIALCISKCNALSICKNSSSPPKDTYNLWAQKLFKAYDLEEFTSEDWFNIFGYLRNILNKFVDNLNSLSATSIEELHIWWLDTQELLKCLESTITSSNVCILSLIVTFVLEVIIKTCKYTEKRNIKSILTIQQLVINIVNNCMFKMPISDAEDFEGFNKVVSSLCDVGALICSSDIKTSIETWRIVAKLSDKCNYCYTNLPDIQTNNVKILKSNWHKNAIFGIFKEASNIIKIFLGENSASNNDNILQVAQFYLKLLKVLIKNVSDDIEFPAIREFFELYTLCSHNQFNKNNKSKMDFFVEPGIYEIFSLIYQKPGITEHILGHLKNDIDNFSSCNLIQNYLHIIIEHCRKDLPYVKTVEVGVLMLLYDNLFEGSLIFIDCDKYSEILEYYVALTILDTTNEMHKQLCKYVMNSKWIQAYASVDILRIFYSYIFKNQTKEKNIPCLEYWLNIWNKLNNSSSPLRRQKMLIIESLLQTMLHCMADNVIQESCKNVPNIEIIMLTCDKKTAQLQQYFEQNFFKSLTKMQEHQIDQNSYREMLNFLHIGILNPDWLLDFNVKENLLKTFVGLFAISAKEIPRFSEYLNKSFNIFTNLNDKRLNLKVLQILNDHLQHLDNIWSVFLIEFLLKQRPQSSKLLQILKSAELKQIHYLMDSNSWMGLKNTTIDLEVFRYLDKKYKQFDSDDNEIKPITKKLRLGECKFSNIKFILNEMNLQSQHLLNLQTSVHFDTTDYQLLNVIKNNIDKCLTK